MPAEYGEIPGAGRMPVPQARKAGRPRYDGQTTFDGETLRVVERMGEASAPPFRVRRA